MTRETDPMGLHHLAMDAVVDRLVEAQTEATDKLATRPAVGRKRTAEQKRSSYIQFRRDPMLRQALYAFEMDRARVPEGMIPRSIVESILDGERAIKEIPDVSA